MPIREPERRTLPRVLQMLKQNTGHSLRPPEGSPFWLPRDDDFNVWSEDERIEELRYMHRNPVKRGLVERPVDWLWSSFHHCATGLEGPPEHATAVPALVTASKSAPGESKAWRRYYARQFFISV